MKQVAVITGANGRIGAATCAKLAQSGYHVVGIDIGADGVGNWPYYSCDLTDLGQLQTVLEQIEREHGLIRVLHNNAGVFHPETDYLDVRPEQYDQTLDVNVKAPFFTTQWVAKRLIAEGKSGAIVSTASAAGQRGSQVVDYGASKAAVINMTKSLSRALGKHNIRVNAIAPGLILGGGFSGFRRGQLHYRRYDRRERRRRIGQLPLPFARRGTKLRRPGTRIQSCCNRPPPSPACARTRSTPRLW